MQNSFENNIPDADIKMMEHWDSKIEEILTNNPPEKAAKLMVLEYACHFHDAQVLASLLSTTFIKLAFRTKETQTLMELVRCRFH